MPTPASASPVLTALTQRNPNDIIAFRDGQWVTVAEFCQEVRRLASGLEAGGFYINLCHDRFRFIQTMFAVALAGNTNLLPPNRQPGSIRNLLVDYPDARVLFDNEQDHLDGLTCVSVDAVWERGIDHGEFVSDPELDDEHVVAIAFTSGSTGKAAPNPKNWRVLRLGAEQNSRNMIGTIDTLHHVLATVPAQHMYGLELSVTMPLVANVCIHAGLPLFPADVHSALGQIPSPRILISTPTHLRAIVKAGLDFPVVARLFSATSPLDQDLAGRVEALFGGELVEIYGCSEAGSIARRLTARESRWTPFDQCTFESDDDGARVTLEYLPEPVPLQDNLDIDDNGRFSLAGRRGDMINIEENAVPLPASINSCSISRE